MPKCTKTIFYFKSTTELNQFTQFKVQPLTYCNEVQKSCVYGFNPKAKEQWQPVAEFVFSLQAEIFRDMCSLVVARYK